VNPRQYGRARVGGPPLPRHMTVVGQGRARRYDMGGVARLDGRRGLHGGIRSGSSLNDGTMLKVVSAHEDAFRACIQGNEVLVELAVEGLWLV